MIHRLRAFSRGDVTERRKPSASRRIAGGAVPAVKPALLVLALVGCTSHIAPPKAVAADDCAAAGANLDGLGCISVSAATFAEKCSAAAADGRTWRADCLRAVTSCGAVEAAYAAQGVCP